MSSTKILRLNKDIKFIISDVIRDLKDPRISGMISIVRTELSNDLSYCKVYVSSLEGEQSAKNAVKGLENAKGYIKREISGRLKIRKIPDLRFVADNSIEHSESINDTLKRIIKSDAEE
ncbi:MAG: 30S ribosome-binding factor RbfA [Oscillospiraceae bacterium]